MIHEFLMGLFRWQDWVLIIFVFLTHWRLGATIGVRPLIAGSITGLAVNAIPVAILSCVAAAPIKYYIWSSLAGNCFLTARYLLRNRNTFKFSKKAIAFYLILFSLGAVFLSQNNPSELYFLKGPKSVTYLYDGHQPYYSGLSTEMLQADYWGRLRVRDLYPCQWSKYHFNHTATHAVLQSLCPKINVATYFICHAVLVTAVILSLVEALFFFWSINIQTIFGAAIWILSLFTVFRVSIFVTLISTGPIALFGLLMFIWSLFQNRRREAIIYSALVGLSASRTLPISLCMMLGVVFLEGVHKTPSIRNLALSMPRLMKQVIKEFTFPQKAFLSLFFVNSAFTFATGKGVRDLTLWGWGEYRPEWMWPTVLHSFLGFFNSVFGFSSELFPRFNRWDLFSNNPSTTWITCAAFFFILFGSIWTLLRIPLKGSAINRTFLLGSVAFFFGPILYACKVHNWRLALLMIIYLVLSASLSWLVAKKNQLNKLWILALFPMGATFWMLITGTGEIQAVTAFVTLDGTLFGVLAAALFNCDLRAKLVVGALLFVLSITLNGKVHGVLKPMVRDSGNVEISEASLRKLEELSKSDNQTYAPPVGEHPETSDGIAILLGKRLLWTKYLNGYFTAQHFIVFKNQGSSHIEGDGPLECY